MSLDLAASYDAIPYEGKPQPPAHPDNLATVARLYGLAAPAVDRCRVLELGCADGGNLVPLAATLPHGEFVGLDLSPRQIADAQVMAESLALTNIHLHARSILDIDDSWGVFDYLICHGVYSWVPPDVQDKILDVCQRNLAPNGVAYVSYNTYPGWYMRGAARDLMVFHTRRFDEPGEKVRQARTILDYFVQVMPQQDATYTRVLREEADLLRDQRDSYVFHEHLEMTNSAVYFHEFVARAAAKGLQYLGEAAYHSNIHEYAADVRSTMNAVSPDRLHLEQYLDFLTNRTFRRTLLCRAGLPVSPRPSAELVMTCGLTALARPTPEAPDVASAEVVEFRTEEGFSASTNVPPIKAALLALYEEWPRCVPFDELWRTVCAKLPAPPADQARHALAEALLQCWLTNVVEIHVTQAPICLTVGERPVAFPVARFQAKAGARRVCNLRHRTVPLDDVDRKLVQLLDGTRDRAALARELGAGEELDERLSSLAKNSLLAG
jgi:methyltransferase-like protein/cyclopropane fatty-acyl-phospholipid synthase-like methyltransferase